MPKLRLLAAALLLTVTGCHHSRNTDLSYSVVPVAYVTDAVSVECHSSSTGKCHFAFTGAANPATVSIEAGETATIHGISGETRYCGTLHKDALENCKQERISPTRQNVTMRSSDDAPKTN